PRKRGSSAPPSRTPPNATPCCTSRRGSARAPTIRCRRGVTFLPNGARSSTWSRNVVVEPEDRDLVLRARGGDRAAFAVLAERHAPRLTRFLVTMTGDEHTA